VLILVSGEGPTDMGRCLAVDPCNGDGFQPGPMAWLMDQIVKSKLEYSFLEFGLVHLVSKRRLTDISKGLPQRTLAGRKRRQETAYYFRNARALARLAMELAASSNDEVVAVLFRDADGTQSAGRGHWQDKWDSMLNGFRYEHFGAGVPMIPKPKSEAWLLCALKQNQPYQHCSRLEDASGNDDASDAVKKQLAEALGQPPTATLLSELVRNGRVEAARIDMPSFVKFHKRLQSVLGGPPVNRKLQG